MEAWGCPVATGSHSSPKIRLEILAAFALLSPSILHPPPWQSQSLVWESPLESERWGEGREGTLLDSSHWCSGEWIRESVNLLSRLLDKVFTRKNGMPDSYT